MRYIVIKESNFGSFYIGNDNNCIEDKQKAQNLADAMQKVADLKEGNKTKYYALEIPETRLKVAINE